MSSVQLWTLTAGGARNVARSAERAEKAGWHGLAVVDSQNLSGASYVSLAFAAAATERLGLGTAVTNPVTRHPVVTAGAIASIQAASGGRACLGIEIFFRIGRELGPAAARAEVVGVAAMHVAVRRRFGIDRHAADGIEGLVGGDHQHGRVPPR